MIDDRSPWDRPSPIRTFLRRAWPVVAILAGAVLIALIPIVLQAMGVDMSGGGG